MPRIDETEKFNRGANLRRIASTPNNWRSLEEGTEGEMCSAGGLARGLRSGGFHETEHGLLQLRIYFVGDGHHIE
jgi:hypothetical protein